MSPHDELDLLSSYLDGELDASDRARLDAHMTLCADCRATLIGLQATVADLRTLPEPSPTPQDSWALRAAIRRARSPMRRWQRVSWAAGAVAAAGIVFAAVTLPGGNVTRDFASSAAQGERATGAAIYQSGQNLTAADAQALLLDVAGIVPGAVSAPVPTPNTLDAAGGPTNESATAGGSAYALSSGTSRTLSMLAGANEDDPARAAIDRCVTVVRGSTQEFLEPIRYEIATFESKPSFLLFFRTSARYELWVVARSDCNVLYFGQA